MEAALKRIDEMVHRQMKQDGIPGLSLAITDRNGLIYDQTYGFASLESRSPVEPKHLFEFGSIGKSFTSILLLQMAERGEVDLHAPVQTYLPWFEVRSEFEPITLHHLMTHTAGIINGSDFPADARFEVWSLRETKATNPPGEQFHYSNVGYKALGLVLQSITGQSYGELVQDYILDPVEMHDTAPAITHNTRLRLATGYRPFYDDRPRLLDRGLVPATWLETDTADGCIAGTATDLARYLRMLMNGGDSPNGRIISEESFDSMTQPQAPMTADDLGLGALERGGYGYGLYSFTADGQQFIGHSGGMVGYFAHMAADLTTGIGAVTLINGPGQQRPIVDFALHALRAARAGEELPDVPETSDPLCIAGASEYAGTFHAPGDSISIKAQDNRLSISHDHQEIQLEPRESDAFVADDERFDLYLLQFERDAEGRVIAVHHGSDTWRKAEGEPIQQPLPAAWTAYTGHYRSHNPWQSNFRVIARAGTLLLAPPWGEEVALTDRGDGVFRVGDERSPEFISFDTIVDGQAWRAQMSGCDYYRFFTP